MSSIEATIKDMKTLGPYHVSGCSDGSWWIIGRKGMQTAQCQFREDAEAILQLLNGPHPFYQEKP